MKRQLTLVALTLILAGCAGDSSVDLKGVPPARRAVFATQLAGPRTYLAPMPTAIILLKPYDMTRNRAFCTAFMNLPTAGEAMARSVVAPNLILTRWLTQLNEVPADRARDCDYLVGTYDYQRAAALMASFHGQEGTMAGNGPFLAMVIPDGNGLHLVAVDGSRYDTTDFDNFVTSWNDAINRSQSQLTARPAAQPGLVRSVFDLVSAVLRTVFGGTAGLIRGTMDTL